MNLHYQEAEKIYNKEISLFSLEDQKNLSFQKIYCINQLYLYRIKQNNLNYNLSDCLRNIDLLQVLGEG